MAQLSVEQRSSAGAIPDWAREELGLREVMGRWIATSIRDQQHVPYRGGKRGHDEGTFTASWCGYYLLTGEPKVIDFMRSLRDQYLTYSEQHQVHGYDDWGEVHHQTEHIMIFMTRLWHLDKSDRLTIDAIEDAAHHAGNWVSGIPEWYDWEHHRFRSWSMGTRLVQDYPPYDFNVPDHFKVLQMALTAYLATGKERYLELCCDYTDMWTKLILEAGEDDLPSVIFNNEMSRAERERIYARPRGMGVRAIYWHYDAPCSVRTELFVAASALEMMLDLYRLTGVERYAEAVAKLLPPVVVANAGPDVEMPALQLMKYRWATGDTRYDDQIMEQVVAREEQDISRMVLLSGAIYERNPIVGRIGWRVDQVRWGYQGDDGSILLEAGPSPASLMLGYQISGDEALATRALAKARRRMELTAFVLRDGREHGCAAHSVHSVAAGHGRAIGAGCVTTTLYPFALGAYRYAGSEVPAVRYSRADGSLGLPEGVAAHCQPLGRDQLRVQLCNLNEEEVTMGVAVAEKDLVLVETLVNGRPHPDVSEGRVRVTLLPSSRLEIMLRYG